MKAVVRLDIASFKRLQKAVKGPSGKVLKAMERWIPIYRLFIFERFKRFSKGGGNWKKLRAAYRQQKIRAGLSRRILVRHKIIEEQLVPRSGTRGVRVRRTKRSLVVQFAPTKSYPSGVPVKTILRIHDKGEGNNPRRTVLVSPTNKVFRDMVKVSEDGFQDELDGK